MHVDQEEVWVALSSTERPELGEFAYGIAPISWLESNDPPVDFCRLDQTVLQSGERLVPLKSLTRDTENDTHGVLCVYWQPSLMLWPVTDEKQLALLRSTVATRNETPIEIDDPEVAEKIGDLAAQSRFVLDLQRIEFGMTLEQVETIMGRYKDMGWPPIETLKAADEVPDPGGQTQNTDGARQIAMQDSVLYRYNDNTSFSVVRFKNGRAVGIVFSPQ